MNLINRTTFRGLCFTLLIIISGCDDLSRDTPWQSTGEATLRQSSPDKTTLTIGDIDPDTPINRIRKIRPLADHLAKELGWDKASVNIRIARNIDELVAMLRKGDVDLFIDSSYPSVLVANASGSGIFLETLVDGARTYQSVIISLASSNARELKHLGGSTIALQEEYSTSGHLLPSAMLGKAGFKLEPVDNPQDQDVDTIGFVYSSDEENTLSMLRKGIVLAGALSSQDYYQLPAEVMKEFVVLAESPAVPRKLASFREGMDPTFCHQLIEIMLAIDDADRQEMTRNNGWNWEFTRLDEQSHNGIATIKEMITQLADNYR
ncbi:MAG: phosphate/phosphite/phosphonate ABC transporter substrate-binding protein [Proteobacteria bacterium]|nr:phosphate/phosphite/phosphonate ABC transporter substrate-binding protein [Pseudomonadota bacterium]